MIEVVDRVRRKAHGGDRGNQYTGGKKPNGFLPPESVGVETRYEVAELVGTSPSTVTRARVVYDDPEAMAEVERAIANATPPAGFDTRDTASTVSMCAQARLLRSRCPGNGSSVRIGGQNARRPGK